METKIAYSKETLASNVKRIRQFNNFTQLELARHVGIFRTYMSRIEMGTANPSLTVIVGIAAMLNVPPHQLLVEPVAEAPLEP